MKRKVSTFVCTLAFLLPTVVATAKGYYEKILLERQIESTSDGIGRYLTSLHPTPDQKTRVARLIEQLGDADSFAQREEAMSKLLVMPVLPNEALITASNGRDPEVRWRARMILKIGKPESEKVLYATFKTVEEKKLAGVVPELLRVIPLCDKHHLVFAASQALQASARASDADVLRKATRSKNLEVKASATAALAKALGKEALDDLKLLVESSQEKVKLAAARGMASVGDRSSIEAMFELMNSTDVQLRVAASIALREFTGKFYGFAAYDTGEKRAAAIKKWKAWFVTDGQTAKLKFPLTPFGADVSYLGGNTLLAFGYKKKVAEIDPEGNEVWTYTNIKSAWSAEKLANGNYLISAYQDNKVIEVDSAKNIVWEYPSTNCLNARPLRNGNILIAEIGGRKVIEVDRQKNIVWKHEPGSSCYDAHRLDNGNTMIAVQGFIREVSPDGQKVWEYAVQTSHGFQPQRNGNVLICDSSRNRVIEVTREKKIIWEHSENYPVDVFRLPNGNTLITGNQRFTEVTPGKKVIWSLTGCSYGSARR
ncbi:MAG: PQQ-binding-like beta-propeller repeat protein [Planctomycetes bacterium]|nr:PQQ-binding-like beta-propeller repeat protein [Planctomycetota bacterium]